MRIQTVARISSILRRFLSPSWWISSSHLIKPEGSSRHSQQSATSVASEIYRKGLEQWQLQWNYTAKGAVCRSFFPNLMQRLKAKIPITPEFTALVTGHGKTRSYLHRFKLADDPMCPCNEGQQTSDHIILDCNLLEAQRGPMIKKIVDSGGSWPPAKDELTTKYLQAFSIFVKSIDFQTLNSSVKDLEL